jgi:2-oxoglutarate dehydrogenase E2 component (dihydrolipoamide succinyltransferase)
VTIETDKVVVEIRAPDNGVITKTLVNAGTSVNVGADLFIIDSSAPAPAGQAAAAPKAEAPKKEEAKAQPQQQPQQQAAPSKPTPPPQAAAAPKKAEPKIEMPKTSAPTGPREQRETMTRLRQRISQRLKDSQNTYALLTTFNEIDMSNIMALREKYKDEFSKKHGVKLGFMSAFVKASAAALKEQPVVNAVIDGTDIVYRNFVDISVAVATPNGLVVPVIRNVDQLSFADVEKTLVVLGQKARDGKIEMEDMAGGTFTISNGGVYGSMMGTPIVNPPQSAILGMHGITKRAVVVNDQIVIRPMMYVALTYDHRLIDGREAVTFLRKIKDVVEDPSRLLLDV